jgi:hypothetical protein
MELNGSGGLLLLVIAVLWFGFMIPSGKSGLGDATKRKRRRVNQASTPVEQTKSAKVKVISQQIPWFDADLAGFTQDEQNQPETATKIAVNRLPDPLSARLGKIENVKWAEVRELNQAREVKENLSAETLDQILQRRRSNE